MELPLISLISLIPPTPPSYLPPVCPALQEVLPALKVVLAPPIRAFAAHLLSLEEQQLLAHTVGVMLDYGLSYDLQVAAAQEAAGGAFRPGEDQGWVSGGGGGRRRRPLGGLQAR